MGGADDDIYKEGKHFEGHILSCKARELKYTVLMLCLIINSHASYFQIPI